MDITHMAITTRIAIIDLTHIMAIMGGRHSIGTADTDIITAIMVTNTIITDVELARKQSRASRIFG
jgi:hypothetical protein